MPPKVVGEASSTSDAPLPSRQTNETEAIQVAWSEGQSAPVTLYRDALGRLAEAVVMDEPHEVILEQGKKIPEHVATLVNSHLNTDDTLKLSVPPQE